MAEEASVSTTVSAPADRVFSLVADLTRMGQWSPECERVEWLGGASGTAVGARFKGHNRRDARRWATHGKVVVFEPGRELAFDITSVGNLPVSRWIYRVEPEGEDRCTLIETWQDRRGGLMKVLGRLVTGVKDREAHNTAGMEQTLQRIRAAAEASA
jgi:uncharacterized protein YndB with AHSA1/START domain